MANKWPDGGEQPLTRGEKLAMGAVAVLLVGALVAGLLLLIVSLLGPRPSVAMVIGSGVVGLAAALLWVQPWETEPPRAPRRRPPD